MPYQIHIATRSQKSERRDFNEDSLAHDLKRNFFILADGIGGEAGGQFASKFVIERLSNALGEILDSQSYEPLSLAEGEALLKNVVEKVHVDLVKEARDHAEFDKAGTTLCVLLFLEKGGLCVHAGDSRAYLFRQNKLHPLTKDHTLYNQGLEDGSIEEGSVDSKVFKKIIVKAVGMTETCDPSFSHFYPEKKDFYLICSDGLTDVVEDEIIAKILFQELPLEAKVAQLVKTAGERGAADDVSVMLLELIGTN